MRHRRRLRAAALILAAGAILAIRVLPPDRELMKIATPVLQLTSRDKVLFSSNRVVFGCPYYVRWLNDSDILLGKTVDIGHWQLHRKQVIPALNEKPSVPFTPDPFNFGEVPISLSPDQQWLIYGDFRTVGKFRQGYFRLSGSHHTTSGTLEPRAWTWTASSRSIVDCEHWPQSIRFIDATTGHVSTMPLKLADTSHQLRDFQPAAESQANHLIFQFGDRYFNRSQPAISFRSKQIIAPSVCSFLEIDLDRLDSPPRYWDVKIPADADEGYAWLSMLGDRILWIVKRTETSPVDTAMHQVFPFWKMRSHPVIHWRVSLADGTAMREVAHFRQDAGFSAAYPLPSLLPSGKKVSFIRNETLYNVPVD